MSCQEITRNRLRETNTQKEKEERTIVSKIEIKLQFPYVVQTQALNLMWLTVGV